jgi:hypothetical protein
MDIFDGQGLFAKWFTFRETDPHNSMYDLLDYGDKNFLLNSGSYFVFMFGMTSWFLLMIIVNILAVKCARYSWFRWLGAKAY